MRNSVCNLALDVVAHLSVHRRVARLAVKEGAGVTEQLPQ
jgi:hypothetical protein